MNATVLSALAIALTLIAFLPYIRAVARGAFQPHVVSWGIWGGATLAISAAQYFADGGAGAWPIFLSGLMTVIVAVFAYRSSRDGSVTRADIFFLLLSLCALISWFVTQDPLMAVVLLTVVDLSGFAPTYRRGWWHPHDESLRFYALMVVRNGLAAVALEAYSMTTLLFPLATGFACFMFVMMVMCRRRIFRSTHMPAVSGRIDEVERRGR
jgi:hypothetical protein